MAAVFLCRIYCSFQITNIVKRIEYTKNINTVIDTLFNEIIYKVVCIMAIAKHILTSEKHLKLCFGAFSADKAEPFPRILIKEAKAGVKCCAAPAFKGMVADIIHFFEDALEFIRSHTGGNQRLMRITQNGFGNTNFCHTDTS